MSATSRWLARMAWFLVAIGVAFSLVRTIGKSSGYQDLDFGAIYRGATAVRIGETPYVVDEYGPLGSFIYGPALAYAFLPLGCLDYIWACRVWTILNWVFAASCIAIAIRLAFSKDMRPQWLWPAVWLTAIPTASYFWSGLRVGQLSVLMAALYFAWAYCHRIGRSFSGGLFLAAAAGLKLAPGFLIPYLLIRRDWRGLAGVVAGGLILFLIPACWKGVDGSVRLHLEWAAHCRNTQVFEQMFRPENQSLLGELARLPAISNGHTLSNPDGLTALGRAYPFVLLAVGGVVFGAIHWHLRQSGGKPDRDAENLHIAVLFATMTLIHPRAWTCNFVSLTLPCAMLARIIVERRSGWRLALAGLVLLVGVCTSPKVGPANDWSCWRWMLQGKDFWVAFLVVSICGFCLARRQRKSTEYCHARAA